MKKVSLFLSLLLATVLFQAVPAFADGSGTMTYVGDSVNLTPNATSGSTLFSVTGDTARSGVISIKQCFPANSSDNTTNTCVPVNATRYGATQSSSVISSDGNYFLTGSGSFYYLVQLISATTPSNNGSAKAPSVITIATITTAPPTGSGGSGGVTNQTSGFAEMPFVTTNNGDLVMAGLTFTNSPTQGFPDTTNAYIQQNRMAYLNGGVFGNSTIKTLRLVCLPFKPYDTGDFSYYGGLGSSNETQISGGDVSIFSVNQAGVTQLGILTIPTFTAPPYVNYVVKVLSTPIAVSPNDQLTAYVSRRDPATTNGEWWQNCNISAGI